MAIKKAYLEVVAFLEKNQDSKVGTVMQGVIDLCSAKTGGGSGGGSNFIKDAAGVVTHVFCYYHKKWEAVADVEFGVKTTSPTGLNNMCKEGTSSWTKQQRAAKKAKEGLLNDVASGDILPEDLGGLTADIEAARGKVVPRGDGQGSDDKPE